MNSYLFFLSKTSQHTIEYVIVAFVLSLRHESRLLEQVLLDFGAFDSALAVEMYVNILAESARVVVANSLSVSEGLKDRIGLEYLLLNPVVLPTDGSQELEYELGGLGLACARLATNYHTLVVLVAQHVVVGIVSDGEYVGRKLANLFVTVLLNLLGRVDRQDLVRVDCHKDCAGIRLCF